MSKKKMHEFKGLPSISGGPWANRRSYKSSIEDLHHQITDLFTYLSPNYEEQAMRDSAYYRINYVLNWVFPGAKVSLYGSVASRMYLPNSDLDITVEWLQKRDVPDLKFIAQIFQLTGFYDSVKIIDKAVIPLVKLVEVATNVHIDLSFNVQSFYEVFNWIGTMRIECKYLDPLVLVLKQFLHVHKLNCPFNGGVTSYALVFMVSHFLKSVDLTILPPRLQIFPLGALLFMFFEYYGKVFNYARDALLFSNENKPLVMTKVDLTNNNPTFICSSSLTIVDPVDLNNDLGRSAYRYFTVQKQFCAALDTLRSYIRYVDNESAEHDESSERFHAPPVLSLIVPILPDDIIQRSVAMRNFCIFNSAQSPQSNRVNY